MQFSNCNIIPYISIKLLNWTYLNKSFPTAILYQQNSCQNSRVISVLHDTMCIELAGFHCANRCPRRSLPLRHVTRLSKTVVFLENVSQRYGLTQFVGNDLRVPGLKTTEGRWHDFEFKHKTETTNEVSYCNFIQFCSSKLISNVFLKFRVKWSWQFSFTI